ncbi:hypothetical protein [uncultured Sphingobacterium sp.]|jgi:hypothetical protein
MLALYKEELPNQQVNQTDAKETTKKLQAILLSLLPPKRQQGKK